MSERSDKGHAIELLQQLGLKEYEAKAFVALSQLPEGTAREISDHSEVPRTRVYDAVRVLENKGLVEVQHANPQQFRAVAVDEAVETLRTEYEERTESLRERLAALEPESTDDADEEFHEVWALSGTTAITTRAQQLISEADEEILLVLGDLDFFTEDLQTALATAQDDGVSVLLGTTSEAVQETVASALPEANVFITELDWLTSSPIPGDETAVTRLLLVDRSSILISTSKPPSADGAQHERAVYGRGFDNGLVTIVRRLMATGLVPRDDPGAG